MNRIICLCLTLFLAACSPDEPKNEHNKTSTPKSFVKAAHYFGDTWPITFWQEFELDKVDDDLSQIKNDGFNTIILVVPWAGFESGFQNPNTISDPRMYQRLAFLLDKITQNGLNYMLRLGYAPDTSPNSGLDYISLCTQIYSSDKHSLQWQQYLTNIYNVTQKHPHNLIDVFISWEDFWCPHNIFPLLDEATRKKLAVDTGYTQWLHKQHFDSFETSLGLASIQLDRSKITIPTKSDFSYGYYLKFIDHKFDEKLLTPTRKVFPEAAMEVRVDKARITQLSGKTTWLGHDLHKKDSHRDTYWAPFWGARNEGEKLTAKEALHNFKYFLKQVTDEGQATNHIIDQFNFFDNTPYFPNNANIIDDEIEYFLLEAAPLLKSLSIGYGVWAYRDYTDNAFYNASFEMDLDGWDTSDDVSISLVKNDHQLIMPPNSTISQQFNPHHPRLMNVNAYSSLNLRLYSSSQGKINIYIDNTLIDTFNLNQGNNQFTLSATPFKKDNIDFKIEAMSELLIDELNLSGFTQSLGLYNEFNQPGPHINAIRKMNALLEQEN